MELARISYLSGTPREQWIKSAKLRVGEPYNRSTTEGKSTVYGHLGEIIFAHHYPDWKYLPTYDYDFQKDCQTVDVKTNSSNYPPRHDHDFCLSYTKPLKADFYYFISVLRDFSAYWLIGCSTLEEVVSSEMVKKGSPMPQGGTWKADGYKVLCKHMRPILHSKITNNEGLKE